MHALIIEDEVLVAILIEDYLRERGYTSFDLVATEEEAVSAAKARCPDLISSDVRLAQGSGITAVQEICSERTIPVIFITGSAEEVRERAPGAVIVEKPPTDESLSKALAAVGPDGDSPLAS